MNSKYCSNCKHYKSKICDDPCKTCLKTFRVLNELINFEDAKDITNQKHLFSIDTMELAKRLVIEKKFNRYSEFTSPFYDGWSLYYDKVLAATYGYLADPYKNDDIL